MNRRHYAISVQQASQESPTLARLSALVQESNNRLKAVQELLPPALQAMVRAGPYEEGHWCLLVGNNAAAAKLRQLIPALQAHLRRRGMEVTAIRLKIQT